MTENPGADETISRRTVIRRAAATGSLVAGGLLTAPTATAQQGGTGYVREGQLRGKNNPDEPRFKIVEPIGEETISPECTGRDAPETYLAYKIRCPNFPGGGGNEQGDDDTQSSDSGGCCSGGGGGRRIYLNPNRNVETDLDELYRFVRTRECQGSGPVEADDDTGGNETKYYQVTFKPARGRCSRLFE
ncbi:MULTISPECIES: hypothetical protein [Salinibaculum]|uniref:hypothetical protein n=1 Tax=Salinibaculum TaxID=2732368 RepID=UPI0030D55006